MSKSSNPAVVDTMSARVLCALITAAKAPAKVDGFRRRRGRPAAVELLVVSPRMATERLLEVEVGAFEWAELDVAAKRAHIKRRLGVVAYHVRELEARDVIKLAGTGQVRGALVHYYSVDRGRAGEVADELLEVGLALNAALPLLIPSTPAAA